MGGWVDVWMDGGAGLRIAYSNEHISNALFTCTALPAGKRPNSGPKTLK